MGTPSCFSVKGKQRKIDHFSELDDVISDMIKSMTVNAKKASTSSDPVFDVVSLSPLERLPNDLWWRILELVPESIFEFRLASSTVRARVDNYTLKRRNGQIVDRLNLCAIRGKDSAIELSVIVSKSISKLFELGLKLRQTPFNLVKWIKRTNHERKNQPNTYKMVIRTESKDETIDYTSRRIGRRIGTVSMKHLHTPRELETFSSVLDGISFRTLRVECMILSEEAGKHLLETIKSHGVEQLSLDVQKVAVIDPVKLLLELSSIVRSLQIHQLTGPRHFGGRYLFGAFDVDWVPVFLEMFSGRLDKLFIDNRCYQNYLSLSDADALRKVLPLTGKRLWFSASCKKYANGLSYATEEYTVQADSSRFHSCSLRIKHSSRDKEQLTFY